MADFLKIVKCDISASIWPILIKFGTTMHISYPNLMGNQMFKNPRKSKIMVVGHLKNRKNVIILYIRFFQILHGDEI